MGKRFRTTAAAATVAAGFAVFALTGSASTSLPAGFIDTLLASGLHSPTAMTFGPNNRVYVAQQGGDLGVIADAALKPTPFVHLNVDASGERGLLGVAIDPAYGSNHYFYLYYTVPGSPAHNRVSRFTANGNGLAAVAGSEVRILDIDALTGATNHNGGAIHFGKDGKLYIAVGDNANGTNSQSLATLKGKILRINKDGTIPTDNPFYGTATEIYRAIWALGVRNPYTFAVQPGTGRTFVNDVGESTREEIDDGAAGANYAWPNCEGPCSPPNGTYTDPLFSYAHGGGAPTQNGCAIVGGAFYNPKIAYFPASYVGKYFFSDLCGGWIDYINPASPATATQFATGISSPVDLQVGPDGSLYYLERGTGSVRRISYQQAPTITGFTPASGAVGARVAVTGTYLAGTTQAKLNGKSVPFTVFSDNEVKIRTPPGSTSGPITLTTAAGSATSSSSFTITFGITGFSPANGPVGTLVTVNGVGFTNPSMVQFHGVSSSNVTFDSSSQLRATVPSGARTGNITVIRSGSPSTTTSPSAFTVTR
jgi:glucose/arabinose dehydrogenase